MTATIRTETDELNGGIRSMRYGVGTAFGVRRGVGSTKPGLRGPDYSVCI